MIIYQLFNETWCAQRSSLDSMPRSSASLPLSNASKVSEIKNITLFRIQITNHKQIEKSDGELQIAM